MAGATTGTKMNTAITNDMRRAMRRPWYWSRTRPIVPTRGAAAPTPCRKRPAIITAKVGARMLVRHPAMDRARPPWMTGRRPKRSERGPQTS